MKLPEEVEDILGMIADLTAEHRKIFAKVMRKRKDQEPEVKKND